MMDWIGIEEKESYFTLFSSTVQLPMLSLLAVRFLGKHGYGQLYADFVKAQDQHWYHSSINSVFAESEKRKKKNENHFAVYT